MNLSSRISRPSVVRWIFLAVVISHVMRLGVTAQASPFVSGLVNHSELTPAQKGKVLLSELNCAACHDLGTANASIKPKGAPTLDNPTARLRPDFLAQFIANPHAAKPGTTMPDMLHGLSNDERQQVVAAITDQLLAWSSGRVRLQEVDKEAVGRGRKLYHSVGCVACHTPEAGAPDSVPLGSLEQKYHLDGLVKFLEDPLAVRPGGRMPDAGLDHWEAVDIASYLLRKQKVPAGGEAVFTPDRTLSNKGYEALKQYRCLNCHQPDADTVKSPIQTTRLDEGCLSNQSGSWPHYQLGADQRDALKAALKPNAPAPTRHQQIEIEMARFNCYACHKRDGIGGPSADRDTYFTSADPNLGEQGRVPPDLSLVGSKLKMPWLRKVVAHGASARPYMKTRMPSFGEENVQTLVDLIKRADRTPPIGIQRVKDVREARKIGHELAGTRGLSCVSCHPFRGKSSSTIQATDLLLMYERLEEHWFHRYMTDPQSASPLTIMPSFWPGGKSALPDVLDGNASQQRDALWQYLARGPEARQPAGIRLEPLKLVVKDEAVMLRRSYPGIGKRGIGVGYPGGVNLSFDAGQVRLASIWHGEFIEASGVWRGQGHGNVRVQGQGVVQFPEGPAFAVLKAAADAWPKAEGQRSPSFQFRGYTLDDKQRPTFEYEFNGIQIRDAFLDVKGADGRGFLRRTLSWESDSATDDLFFRIAGEMPIEKLNEMNYRIGKSLRIRVPQAGVIRPTDNGVELILPLNGKTTAIIEYHWEKSANGRR
jgi:mono/diheme cytochrome c family protein